MLPPNPRHGGAGALEVCATLCTALRSLESLACRPHILALSGCHVGNMVHSVAAAWAACTPLPLPEELPTRSRLAQRDMINPGSFSAASFNRVPRPVSQGAAVFTASCSLLLSILRQRRQELGRCVPLLVQACRALLTWLVGAELAAKLAPGQLGDVPAWRVGCAEALARVFIEMGALKASTSRYCPHLLADYIILAASPLTPKARHLLGCGPQEEEHPSGLPHPWGPAEGGPLVGGTLCDESAAVLRQGACALYDACSASELQYLYACLGQPGGAVWRGALSSLKAHYEQHFRYSGKV